MVRPQWPSLEKFISHYRHPAKHPQITKQGAWLLGLVFRPPGRRARSLGQHYFDKEGKIYLFTKQNWGIVIGVFFFVTLEVLGDSGTAR